MRSVAGACFLCNGIGRGELTGVGSLEERAKGDCCAIHLRVTKGCAKKSSHEIRSP